MFGRPCDLSLGFNQQRQSIETIIYPNPIQKGETLHIQSNGNIESVTLFDALGKIVDCDSSVIASKIPSNSMDISLQKLPAGLYTIKISQTNKVISFKKILIL
jgi:hypothetical protein